MNKIQNNNNRKTSNTYLKNEIKEFRYSTDPSPLRSNKENFTKPSFLKPTLQNHLIKTVQERTLTPTIGKASIVNIFLKQEEQPTEIKLNSCQQHKKRLKYEVQSQQMCSRCAIEYAIQQGIQIEFAQNDKKMLTFGQEVDHEIFNQFSQSIQKDLQILQNLPATGDGMIKKKEVKEFIIKIGEMISSHIQLNKTLQETESNQQSVRQSINKIVDEIGYLTRQILQQMYEKQPSQSTTVGDLRNLTNQQVTELKNIKSDIMQNLDNILNSMDFAPFKIIINKYNEKLRQFEQTQNDLREQVSLLPQQAQPVSLKFKIRDITFSRKLGKLLNELMEGNNNEQSRAEQLNNNTKFFQLLQKVNNNQNTNSIFYNSLLKDIGSEEKLKQLNKHIKAKLQD